jgi:hypothetical protein
MTKYLVFKNQPDSEQTNVPGSREEMASEIANVVSQDRMPPNYYIAWSGDLYFRAMTIFQRTRGPSVSVSIWH